jgi:hypothetical protein
MIQKHPMEFFGNFFGSKIREFLKIFSSVNLSKFGNFWKKIQILDIEKLKKKRLGENDAY